MAVLLVSAGTSVSMADATLDLIDPTRPYGARAVDREPTAAGPVLQSTIVSGDERRAMISGRYYRVGDQIGAAQLVDIRPNRVTLRRAGVDTTLSLFSRVVPIIKRELTASN